MNSQTYNRPIKKLRIALIGLLAAAIPCTVSAQTFRSGTILIRAETLVEENGRVLSGLQAEDFAILDESLPQPIANFAAESGAIRLALLLDASGSMQPAARQLAQTGLAAMSALRPDDQVALLTFDKKATVRVPLTVDRGAIIAGVSKLSGKPLGGGTDIYRALADAAKYLGPASSASDASHHPAAPNVILVLTDNAARADTTEAAALREIWAASAAVDGLVVSSAPMWDEKVSQSLAGLKLQDVRRIADQTGGVVQQTPNVEMALRGALERSRTRYSIYFRQPDAAPGTLRHLKIDLSPAARTKHPSAIVRSRTAYYAE